MANEGLYGEGRAYINQVPGLTALHPLRRVLFQVRMPSRTHLLIFGIELSQLLTPKALVGFEPEVATALEKLAVGMEPSS